LGFKSDDFTAILLQVNLYKRTDRSEAASDVFEQAIQKAEDSAAFRLEYAKFLIQTQRIPEAIEQLELVAEQSQGNAEILYAIGLLAMEVKAYDKAENFYRQLYALDEKKSQGAFLLAKLELAKKDNEQALLWFSKVAKGQYFYESLLHQAIILSDQKKYDAAIKLLDSHEEKSGKKHHNQLRLKAEILNQAEKYQAAYEIYSEILENEPSQADLLYGRAMVAEKLGRIDLMEQDLLKIIELNPQDSHALNALGYTLIENTTRYAEAKAFIQRALDIAPNDMATIDSMGWVLYKQGQIKEALVYLKKAYEMENDPEIAAHYGEVLWQLGEQEKAKQVWQKARIDFPEHKLLKMTTEQFLQ